MKLPHLVILATVCNKKYPKFVTNQFNRVKFNKIRIAYGPIYNKGFVRVYPLSTYAKFSEKLTFVTP